MSPCIFELMSTTIISAPTERTVPAIFSPGSNPRRIVVIWTSISPMSSAISLERVRFGAIMLWIRFLDLDQTRRGMIT